MPKKGEIKEIFCYECKEKTEMIYYIMEAVGVGQTREGWKCTKCERITSTTSATSITNKYESVFVISRTEKNGKTKEDIAHSDALILSGLFNKNEPKPVRVVREQYTIHFVFDLDACNNFEATAKAVEINEMIVEKVIKEGNGKIGNSGMSYRVVDFITQRTRK